MSNGAQISKWLNLTLTCFYRPERRLHYVFKPLKTYIPRENYSKLNMQKFIINICLSIKIIFQQALGDLVHLEVHK